MAERAIDIIAEAVRNGYAVRPLDTITRAMWRVFIAARRAKELTWHIIDACEYFVNSVSGTVSCGTTVSISSIGDTKLTESFSITTPAGTSFISQ